MIAIILSSLIFIVSLVLIFSEKIHRTIAAIAGSVLMVGTGLMFGFYSEEQAIASIDFNTLGVLIGMMTLVALLEPTGFFQFVAVKAARFSRGRPTMLLVILGTFTTVLSMFLDNVTTVVLIAPVTILISEVLGVNPIPFLMAEALLSDTGGVATLIGDPPNILIGSAAGFSFIDFLTHSFPVVLVAWLVALLLIRLLFRRELSIPPTNIEAVMNLDPAKTLTDLKTARNVLVVLGIAVLIFLFEEQLGLTPSFIALGAAALALVLIRPPMRETLERLDWSVLVFFVALFVLVGGMEAAGVLDSLARNLLRLNGLNPQVFSILAIWIIAGLSAVVDNIPITIAMIPIIQELGSAGMNVTPIWWALVFGAGFGGNGTIIGSTANIVVASVSERTRTPITSALWNRRGPVIMLATCIIATLFYLFGFEIFN